jgi:hypothetical protein
MADSLRYFVYIDETSLNSIFRLLAEAYLRKSPK